MSKRRSKFVNGNRTKEVRRCLYCMFRTLFEFNRTETRMVVAWRKSVQIRYIEQKYSIPDLSSLK